MPENTHPLEKRPEPVASCLGVRVPASPFLTEMRIDRINKARYEGDEIAGATSVVTELDRVMEMGSGLGIVGAVTAANCKPEKVLSFEANPNLIPHIQALYDLNELTNRISVRNEVVISGPDRPEHIEFHIAKSFLGSSLAAGKRGAKEAIKVPTTSFDAVRDAFKPTVLIMDIEGGELDFLRHADLNGIRAIVIEFHPGVYGVEGLRECKDVLKKAGFRRVNDISTRIVWTAVRDVPQTSRGAARATEIGVPQPTGGWSESIQTLKNAIVVPPLVNGFTQPAGVLHSDGRYCPEGALWRKGRPLTTCPEVRAAPWSSLKASGFGEEYYGRTSRTFWPKVLRGFGR